MEMKTKFLVFVLTSFPLTTNAWPVVCLNCATSIQALQSNISEAKEYVESLHRTVNQIEQLRNQVRNLSKLQGLEWGNTDEQLNNLANIAAQGQALAFSVKNLNQVWDDRFKGYDGYRNQNIGEINSTEQYKKWGSTLRDTSKSALTIANNLQKIQQGDSATLRRLQAHTANADGAVQVSQAGNELLVQVAHGLQKIQTLLQVDIQMTATDIATASDKVEAQRAATDNYYHRKLRDELNIKDGVNWLDNMHQ